MNKRSWIGAVGAAAVVAALPVAVKVLGEGVATAATVPPASATVVSSLTPFDSTANKTIAAVCPAGKRVLGGGARVNAAQHVVLTREEPVHTSAGDSYVVEASEDRIGFAGAWALQAFAICADPPPGLEIVSATGPAGSRAFQVVNADCRGKLAIGAGGRINGGGGRVDLLTIAQGMGFASGTAAGGSEELAGFGGTWSVTAFAVCVTPVSFRDLQNVRVDVAQGPGNRTIAEARCPPGKRVTGGTAFSNIPSVIEVIAPDALRLRVQAIARNDSPDVTNTGLLTVIAFCAS